MSLLPAVTQQAGAEQPGQHAQQNSNTHAQQAQQGTSSQVASLGGVLRKPRPVGIGHMCRAISTLTGGKKRKEKKEKTMPFGVSLVRSQVVYRAAQAKEVSSKLWGQMPNSSSVNARPKLTASMQNTAKQHLVRDFYGAN